MITEVTGKIIGAAIEVHRHLGAGLLEAVYETALCYELKVRSIAFEQQKVVDVIYKDIIIKGQRIDLLVENKIVVELKSTRKHNEIFTAQALSYLKATGLKTALIINFGHKRLIDGIKRISL